MTDERSRVNRAYVAQRKNATTIRIDTRPPARSDGPLRESVFQAFDCLCESFEGLLTVTELDAIVKERDPTVPEADLEDSLSAVDDIESPITVRDSEGVTSADIADKVSEIPVEDGTEVYVPSLEITDSRAQMFLEDGLFTVDTSTTDRYRFVPVSSDTDSDPSKPVLWAKLGYAPGKLAYGYDHPVFKWWINTPTDIWFEDSLVGRINLARLATCFDRLDEALEVLEVSTVSRGLGVTESGVSELFEYDGPDAETLIERY
jgi:hypothetical protein